MGSTQSNPIFFQIGQYIGNFVKSIIGLRKSASMYVDYTNGSTSNSDTVNSLKYASVDLLKYHKGTISIINSGDEVLDFILDLSSGDYAIKNTSSEDVKFIFSNADNINSKIIGENSAVQFHNIIFEIPQSTESFFQFENSYVKFVNCRFLMNDATAEQKCVESMASTIIFDSCEFLGNGIVFSGIPDMPNLVVFKNPIHDDTITLQDSESLYIPFSAQGS